MSILEPTAARPGFAPGYGISAEEEGMLSWAWADERLAAGRNYWVASARPDGSPHAAPVWGVWFPEGIYFSTSRSSRKGRNLARDRRCVVHSESGDEVVILEGEVEEVALDDRIADAYEAKYDTGRSRVGRVRSGIASARRSRMRGSSATTFARRRGSRSTKPATRPKNYLLGARKATDEGDSPQVEALDCRRER